MTFSVVSVLFQVLREPVYSWKKMVMDRVVDFEPGFITQSNFVFFKKGMQIGAFLKR